MERHSSFFFIWLQLELCAMAILLTKGELQRRSTSERRGIQGKLPRSRGAGDASFS